MKQFIVLLSMILLGIVLYRLIAGPGDGSLFHVIRGVWRQELLLR